MREQDTVLLYKYLLPQYIAGFKFCLRSWPAGELLACLHWSALTHPKQAILTADHDSGPFQCIMAQQSLAHNALKCPLPGTYVHFSCVVPGI